MLPQTHFLFAFLLGLVGFKLAYLTLTQALIAGFVGMLIDLDHLFSFIIHKEFNLRKIWNEFLHHEHEGTIIHGWVGLILMTILLVVLGIFYLNLAIIIGIGYYTHFVLDLVYIKTSKKLVIKEPGFVMKIFYWELIFQAICLILVIIAIIR